MAGKTLPSNVPAVRSAPAVVALAFGIAVAAVSSLVTGAPVQAIVSVALLVVVCGAVVAARVRLAGTVTSPVAIVTLGLVLVGTAGLIGYSSLQGAVGATSARVVLSPMEALATFEIFLSAAVCVFAGGLLFSAFKRRDRSGLAVVTFRLTLTPLWRTALLWASALTLLVSVAAAGPALIHRDLYIESHVGSGGVYALIGHIATASGVVLGFIATTSRGGPRLAALLLAGGFLVLFVGDGSRKMALLPILFALGAFVGRRSKVTVMGLFVASLLSVLLLQFALYVRTLPSHGLMPYIQSLPALSQSDIGWDSALLNVLFSFGIVGATAFQVAPLDPAWFWTSITPVDGLAAGWYEIAPHLRLNVYTPYAAIGELANYGFFYFVLYFVIAGLLLGYMDLISKKLISAGYSALALIPVGLSTLFLLYSIQYNLRSSTRFLIYGVIAAAMIQLVVRGRIRRQDATRDLRLAVRTPAGHHTGGAS